MVMTPERSAAAPTPVVALTDSLFGSLPPLPTSPLFGTDGIRGQVGEFLNPALALQVGFWTGQVLRDRLPNPGPAIVGQDSRNSSDMLAMALGAGLILRASKSGTWVSARLPVFPIWRTIPMRSVA